MPEFDTLAPENVTPHLRGHFGTPYLYEPECESTQLLLLDSGHSEGAVAVTDHQTGGRGRHGRRWESPPATSVLVSVVLDPPPERRVQELSLVAALATAATVELTTGLSAQIKWPNDVMLNRRKVAGILGELAGETVVLGIGLNVNQTPDELPPDTSLPAGSLRSIIGTRYDRAAVLGLLLVTLERAYETWRDGGLDDLYGDLGARDFLRGRRITVDGEPAVAVQILRDGRLEIETGEHDTRAIESGEILYAA